MKMGSVTFQGKTYTGFTEKEARAARRAIRAYDSDALLGVLLTVLRREIDSLCGEGPIKT